MYISHWEQDDYRKTFSYMIVTITFMIMMSSLANNEYHYLSICELRVELRGQPLYRRTLYCIGVGDGGRRVTDKQGILRHVSLQAEGLWMSSTKEILLFRQTLLNPVTCQQFQDFVYSKGGFLENDVLFWLEVQRYKVKYLVISIRTNAFSVFSRLPQL